MTDVPTTWQEDKIDELESLLERSDKLHDRKDDMIEKLKRENEEKKVEYSRTNLRFLEAHKKEFDEEIKKQYHYLDKLAEKVKSIDPIINNLKGGK